MSLIKCPECGKNISSQSETCPSCGLSHPLERTEEQAIVVYKYRMFAAAPFWFLLFCGLTFFFGTGLMFLLIWFIMKTPAPTLTITNQAVIYKAHKTRRVELRDIEQVEAHSSIPQSLIGTGYIVIRRKGRLILPLVVNGLPDPRRIQQIILEQLSL